MTAAYATLAFPAGTEPADVRKRIYGLEKLLERAFVIPGTRIPVGMDTIVGLIPVAGDLVTGAMGLYLVWEARNVGASRWLQARMLANVGIDTALGAIPLVGDVFDFVFKSNSKNLRLLKCHLDRHHPASAVVEATAA